MTLERGIEIAYGFTAGFVLAALLAMAGASGAGGSIACARQPHHVYVVDGGGACLHQNAFVPAMEKAR